MSNGNNVDKEGSLRITAQIDLLEEETNRFRKQLSKMEASLKCDTISKDEKKAITRKVDELKTELSVKEKRLSHLHKENKKTTLFAVLVFSLAIIVYVIIKSSNNNSDT